MAAKETILQAEACPQGDVFFVAGGTRTNLVIIDCMLLGLQTVPAADTEHIAPRTWTH